MSQPDLVARLREAQPVAPRELRERVRLLAAQAPPPKRRISWRRSAVMLVPVAAAILAAVVLLPNGAKRTSQPEGVALAPGVAGAVPHAASGVPSAAPKASPLVPAPSVNRLQRYAASLALELPTSAALSDASRRAVAIVTALGGYQQSVVVRTSSPTGYAHIVLRVPAANVRDAIRRLSALGRITAENVAIQDLQVQANATGRLIARLQEQLTALQAQPQTTEAARRIASLTAQIQRLQRTRLATARAAHYATVDLRLTTPQAASPVQHKAGPLHGLGVAFRWSWIGVVYVLALGTPLAALGVGIWLLARTVRRRREDRLLAR